MALILRKMTPADLDGSAKELMAAFKEAPWNENWTYQQAYNRLAEIMAAPVSRGFVAVEGETVVAMSCGRIMTYLDKKLLFLDEFSVHPAYQGQYCGRKLMDFVKEEMAKENIHDFSLITNRGFPCVKFYENNGFTLDEKSIILNAKTGL